MTRRLRGPARKGLPFPAAAILAATVALCPHTALAESLAPLTRTPGDPAQGEALLRDMGRASCLICHRIARLDEKDQGEIGPPLDGVATRMSEGELRARVVDARRSNPHTMMPPYHSLEGLNNVAEAYRGKTIYSAQEVENVVAYLMTLTGEDGQ